MGKSRIIGQNNTQRPRRPALTPEARENQLISDAYDLAEQQIRDGTASSQVISIFLKAGLQKERLERERLEEENKLLRAKTESLQKAQDSKELFERAIKAFSIYKGQGEPDDEEFDDYDEY